MFDQVTYEIKKTPCELAYNSFLACPHTPAKVTKFVTHSFYLRHCPIDLINLIVALVD